MKSTKRNPKGNVEKASRATSGNNVETKKANSSQEDSRKKPHQAGFSDSDTSRSARPIGFDTDLTTPGVL